MADQHGQTLEQGDVLRAIRKAVRLSQEDLAVMLGVRIGAVSRWEMGTRKMSLSHQLLLREILRQPLYRMRLWRQEDTDTIAIRAKLAEPIRQYARTYARGARLLVTEGFAAELADAS